jgi:glutamate transport system substrate-binding protein
MNQHDPAPLLRLGRPHEGGFMRFKRIIAIAIAAGLGLAAGCASGGPETTPTPTQTPTFAAGTTMAKLKDAQKIIIGTKFDQPLFGLKGLDGKPAGFDVEIGKIIAAELGIPADKIEWTETKSAVREEYIEQGKADVVVATYTINDARKQRVAFAGPYYVAGQDILVRKDDNSITGPDSFKDGTKKVCSVTGSTPAKKIEEYVKDKTTQIVLFGGYAECVEALKTKTVDAVTTDNVILLGFAAQEPNALKTLNKPFTQEPYGIGIKKDDTAFRTFINDVLEKIYKDGRYAKAWADTVGDVAPAPTGPSVNRY